MAKRNEFDETALTMLFGEPEESDGGLMELSLEDILPFHTGGGHPFEIVEDADMLVLEEDMRENGQLEPIIVRRDANLQGRFEAIAGHRRTYVARKIGLEKIKALIVDYDDEQAIKLMVVSNLQKRSEIKPSVKAKAYKMYMEANKKQGQRTDATSCPVGTKLRTDESAAEEFGESARNIQRYIRLNDLTPELLAMVDKDELKFRTAVELSYLSESAQEAVTYCLKAKVNLSLEQAKELKDYEKDGGTIDLAYLERWLGAVEEAPKEKRQPKPKHNERFINEYLPLEIRKKSVEEKRAYTQAALVMYNNYLLEHPEEQAEWEEEE